MLGRGARHPGNAKHYPEKKGAQGEPQSTLFCSQDDALNQPGLSAFYLDGT